MTNSEIKSAIPQAVQVQDEDFLRNYLTSENVNELYDFPVTHRMNVHLLDGTERSEFLVDIEKGTLLHLTAWNNLPISAKILIENGADVDVKDAEERTPLEVAANRYDVSTLSVQKILIENKANVNFYVRKNLRNHPLLYVYIWDEEYELAKLTIEHGADVNMRTKDGRSILEFAERRGTPEIVSMLKRRGATRNEQNL